MVRLKAILSPHPIRTVANLHSNMVRLKVKILNTELEEVKKFTFQYGSIKSTQNKDVYGEYG